MTPSWCWKTSSATSKTACRPSRRRFEGVREITTAVIAITITLVAVFLPIAFQSGTTGILFREFAVATAGSVIISAFVALTLTPTLCARILRHEPGNARRGLSRAWNASSRAWNGVTRRTLAWAVRHKAVVVLLGLLSLGLTYGFYRVLPKEFLPDEDKGYVLMLMFAPEGATSEYTDRSVRQAEQIAAIVSRDTEACSRPWPWRGAPPANRTSASCSSSSRTAERRSALELARPGAPASMFMRLINEIKGAQAIAILPKATRASGEQFQLVLLGPRPRANSKTHRQPGPRRTGAGRASSPSRG